MLEVVGARVVGEVEGLLGNERRNVFVAIVVRMLLIRLAAPGGGDRRHRELWL